MAVSGDWIKLRVGLKNDPRVIRMANCLWNDPDFARWIQIGICDANRDGALQNPVTRYVTGSLCVTALVTIWGMARDQGYRDGDDLVIECCSIRELSELVGIPGMGEAMARVGWAVDDESGGVILPKYFAEKESPETRHAKSGAERQREYRERQREKQGRNGALRKGDEKVTKVTPKRRGEENRGEENKKNRNGASADHDPAEAELVKAWNGSEGVRKIQGSELSPSRRAKFRQRLKRPWPWREALAKFPLAVTIGDDAWKPDIDWLLRPDSVERILEGKYDFVPRDRKNGRPVQLSLEERRERMRAECQKRGIPYGDETEDDEEPFE